MKPFYFTLMIAGCCAVFNINAVAQKDSSGIYETGDDFINGKLSLAINCETEKHKITLNDFFNKPYIIVKHNDTSYKFYKKDIFGYKKCDGSIYRFDGKKELLLLNSTEQILIYKHILPNRTSSGLTNVTNFYFSINANSSVQLLTKANLKKAFPVNERFIDEIEKSFKYNTQLALYDDYHQMYKINWIYQKNNQEK